MTLMHQWHVDIGAIMAEFGSYSMPLWCRKEAKQEHNGVIWSAGLFGTAYMAVIVKDADVHHLLQAEALRSHGTGDCTYPFDGFYLRKISVETDAAVLDKDGAKLGTVLTCTTGMVISRDGEKNN